MKKFISAILLIVFALSIFPQDVVGQNTQNPNNVIQNNSINEIRTAEAEAIREAKNVSTTKWCCISATTSVCCGGIGCLGSTLIAYLQTPDLPAYVYAKSPAYQNAFRTKYQSKVKKRKATSACIGGTVTVVLLTTASIILQLTTGAISTLMSNVSN